MREMGRSTDPGYHGMRMLAAEVIKYAISDYHSAVEALRNHRKHPYVYTAKEVDMYRRTRWETKAFLTNDTLFHQVLDLDPDYFARLIDEGTLPVVEWRSDKRKD